MSTPALVSLLRRMSFIWSSWKSLSPTSVMSFSFSSMEADVPLKSKRVPISLPVFSTAFLTLTRSASRTVSKEGMVRGLCYGCWGETITRMLVEKNVPLQHSNSFGIVAKALSLIRVAGEADIAAVLCRTRP
jgi:hypothetical protein